MPIRIGERVPNATLWEFIDEASDGCPVGPNALEVDKELAGRKVVVFGLPGAYTPTCSGKHVPGYVDAFDRLRAKGVDQIWCVSVNDAFVMGAWGREQGANGRVRMMADGNAQWTRALGLEQDMTARGFGLRSQRYAMIVEDGIVKALNVEQPGKFEVSDAESILKLL